MQAIKCFICILLLYKMNILVASAMQTVCYYNATSVERNYPTKYGLEYMREALPYCDYLVYGYVGIDFLSMNLRSLNIELDVDNEHLREITELRNDYSHLKIMLSVGGGADTNECNKYLKVLEQVEYRNLFINCTKHTLRAYDFDGIDLAWQFPRRVKKEKKTWYNKILEIFSPVEDGVDPHKAQFTALLREMQLTLRLDGRFTTLTVLPHVDYETYIDIGAIMKYVEFVNLPTYDFITPVSRPDIADFAAALKANERNPTNNVDYHVQQWLRNGAYPKKLHVSIPLYGHIWQIADSADFTREPPIEAALGAYNYDDDINGVIAWTHLCNLFRGDNGYKRRGSLSLLQNNKKLWISYDDEDVIDDKLEYVQQKQLAGVALFDITMDDFSGRCEKQSFKILRQIKMK